MMGACSTLYPFIEVKPYSNATSDCDLVELAMLCLLSKAHLIQANISPTKSVLIFI